MKNSKYISIGIKLHRFFLALISVSMLTVWFYIDQALYPLHFSIPVIFFFGFWVLFAPTIIIKGFRLKFYSFESMETEDSLYYFSRGNLLRYLLSLRSPSTKQMITAPLCQIALNVAIGTLYYFMVKAMFLFIVTVPLATLGGYLALRSLFYSICLVVSISTESIHTTHH